MSSGSSALDHSSRTAIWGARLGRSPRLTRGRTGRRTRLRTAHRGGRSTCRWRGAGAGSRCFGAAGRRVHAAAFPDSDSIQIFCRQCRCLFHEALFFSFFVPGLRLGRSHPFLRLLHRLAGSSNVIIDVDGRLASAPRCLLWRSTVRGGRGASVCCCHYRSRQVWGRCNLIVTLQAFCIFRTVLGLLPPTGSLLFVRHCPLRHRATSVDKESLHRVPTD